MRIFLISVFTSLMLTGCVAPDTAVAYAQRAHPDCTDFRKLSHHYGGEQGSQTEVAMTCNGQERSITVKCIFGMGFFSQTTCHENN